MKRKICYNANELTKLLPNYELRKFNVRICGEDDDGIDSQWYLCLPIVKDISMNEGLFWTSMHIVLKDETEIKAESDNVHSVDGNTNITRINNNNFVSPKLRYNDGYIESTKELNDWLVLRGITENKLEGIIKTFDLYGEIEYPGVFTPEFSFERWSYSTKPLVLKEQEIETVLSGIDDVLLREKIKCILYARIFKNKYHLD